MTEDELQATIDEYGYDADGLAHVLIANVRDLREKASDAKQIAANAVASASGAVELQQHRADRAEARVAELEREALANARTVVEAIGLRTSLAILVDRARVVGEANLELANLNRATLHNVDGIVRERDALKALVDAATGFRFGRIEVTQDPVFGYWQLHDGHTYVDEAQDFDDAVRRAKARDLAAKAGAK